MALIHNRKRKRVSKNKKKNWRKTDIDDVEEYLDDHRLEERTGGPIADKLNAELFFVDKDEESTVPTKRERKESKPLRCHANLILDASIKPVKTGHNKGKAENIAKRRSERVKNSMKNTQILKKTEEAVIKKQPKRRNANRDLWAEKDTEGDKIDSFHNQYTKKSMPKPPKHHLTKPTELNAVEPAHPGQSYNPSFEDHQALILKATLVEEIKLKEQLRIKRALDEKFPTKAQAPTEESYMNEMSAGLFDDNEPRQEFTEEELERISINPAVRRENKKTPKQRRKERERKEKEQLRLSAKKDRIKKNEYFRLKSMKKEIKQREAELVEKAQQKEEFKEHNKNNPKRLGKIRYEEPDLEVKLSDELEGTLRQLKPEGNLMHDRFKSMQKRNIITPTERTKRAKKWGKPKYFEKKSHKEITE